MRDLTDHDYLLQTPKHMDVFESKVQVHIVLEPAHLCIEERGYR